MNNYHHAIKTKKKGYWHLLVWTKTLISLSIYLSPVTFLLLQLRYFDILYQTYKKYILYEIKVKRTHKKEKKMWKKRKRKKRTKVDSKTNYTYLNSKLISTILFIDRYIILVGHFVPRNSDILKHCTTFQFPISVFWQMIIVIEQ